ncbi:Piso0_004495 [Millerozyma farinosa CBS 7064]|uniref:Piso0_004495 protein n=1 Tax=Pichia sorbitophila (strain ATCC MYA-4447 / BCRC 22081 / CBS 7064 / NBRC 10061 / NRRL Y-12695) TaxID=559304 RepID=G8Y8Y4_PICSO|nr:Piso0_004495 [Millerozyma farinosa CBS 7064]CCE84929.1 Piso0_004495 [Millerozyma farinosa CBS 7064]
MSRSSLGKQGIEDQIAAFREQQFPSLEETLSNNKKVLYKRKKHFLSDLKETVKFSGFLLIAFMYLKDISFFRLVLRSFVQYTIGNPLPRPNLRLMMSDQNKMMLSKLILGTLLAVNTFCFLMHCIFGVYKESPFQDDYLYGSLFVQYIGERLPYSRLELVVLDVAICFFQLLYHILSLDTDDSEVLSPGSESENGRDEAQEVLSLHKDGDGYTGNVHLITIDIISAIKRILSYEGRFQMPQLETTETDIPTINSNPFGFV